MPRSKTALVKHLTSVCALLSPPQLVAGQDLHLLQVPRMGVLYDSSLIGTTVLLVFLCLLYTQLYRNSTILLVYSS